MWLKTNSGQILLEAKMTMQAAADTQEIYAKLNQWDMTTIKKYMVEKSIYGAEEVDTAEKEYKKFLALALSHPGTPIPISDAVDPFWHTHILFTHDYSAMGKEVSGGYIHHIPAIKEDLAELAEPFGKHTLALYRKHFGEPDPKLWNAECCKKCTCHVKYIDDNQGPSFVFGKTASKVASPPAVSRSRKATVPKFN